MPIGLPEFSSRGGRGPEALVRPLLGSRQSSVFSIPSRAAVYAETAPFTTVEEWYAAHRRASGIAMRTSDPPRGVSIQAFGIFSKIREIDRLLIEWPTLRARLFESHPEAAFWKLNADAAAHDHARGQEIRAGEKRCIGAQDRARPDAREVAHDRGHEEAQQPTDRDRRDASRDPPTPPSTSTHATPSLGRSRD